jgi:hypothetical protein
MAEAAELSPERPYLNLRKKPLLKGDWEQLFDEDGRIVQVSRLRQLVFSGGVDPSLRSEVWKYLLGYFPFETTFLEREVIRKERRVEYEALKARWKEVFEPSSASSCALDLDGDGDPQLAFMRLQSMLNAQRTVIDESSSRSCLRVIKKDVPRTDRKEEFYAGDENVHLSWLHDILVTYAVFNPDVGYVQGMNDILSMILFVMDDEADAYSCFSGYMATVREDFTADGIIQQLTQLAQLLELTDPELNRHFAAIDAADLAFCHRWLLLSFKREFSFNDSLRLFEVLASHHLELSCVEADRTRNLEKRKEREKMLSSTAPDEVGATGAHKNDGSALDAFWWMEHKYKFGCFLCLAVFRIYRERFVSCVDAAALYTLVNSLVEQMAMADVLAAAEATFFEFCRLSAH